MTYCTKCGKQNTSGTKFCTGCGSPLTVVQPNPALTSSLPLKNKSNRRSVVIGSIIFVALLIGSYFLFFNKSRKSNAATDTEVSSSEASTLKNLVLQWNTGLNAGIATNITSLYAERIVYYRNQMSKGNATVLLTNFFLKNPNFHQEINGEIALEKISGNLIVCNFQKTVSQNGKTTDYPSYLKFSKEGDLWKIVEEGDKITDYNIGKQNDVTDQQTVLNNWIRKNISDGIAVDLKTTKTAGFNASNYTSGQTSFSSSYGDYLNVTGLIPQISAVKNWIVLAFNGEDVSINFFLGKEKVFRSYHLSAGSNGGTTSYDLVSGENKDYPFTITEIKGNMISMYQDGYDDGHYWQSGTYDIISGNTSWGAKEH